MAKSHTKQSGSQSQSQYNQSFTSSMKTSTIQTRSRRSSALLSRIWTAASKINYFPEKLTVDSVISRPGLQRSVTQRKFDDYALPTEKGGWEGFVPVPRVATSDEDMHATYEKFPAHVTTLLNEDRYWGCFYPFQELYDDKYSPVVVVFKEDEVPDMVGGVLTRDMISTCLTYLKRIPILGDLVYVKLDLSRKHLVNIEVLQHYKFLVYLDLSCNLLTEITVLSKLLYLQYISVSYNRMNTVLEYEVPQWFLTEVHYKYNSVTKIRDLSMFWSITVIDLSHNNIKTISGLESLNYLRRLDLSFNHIQRLENLNHLRLRWLDLSYNNISSFEFGPNVGLWTLLDLEFINLNENKLTSMKIFSGCTRLKQMHARNNGFSMLLELAVYMRQMRRLFELDLRANPICDKPGYKKVVINTFPLLVTLDAQELDPLEVRLCKMYLRPDVHTHATHRLLRLLYIQQLYRATVSPYTLPADTQEVPIVVIVGYECVGKGTLSRRLATKFSHHLELGRRHTTATYHLPNHYIEVSREKFDEMLIHGDFLTYSEMNGESYGLSRQEAYVKDGKVKIVTMNLTSAMMLKLRGMRPYLILASVSDNQTLMHRQFERKAMRNKSHTRRSSIEEGFERSTLQVLVSGRIIITGILNEILLEIPEEKDRSVFRMGSTCSLLLDSDVRQAAHDYVSEFNILNLLASESNTIMGDVGERGSGDNSLCSLYKYSTNAENVSNQDAGQGSYDNSSAQTAPAKKSTTDNTPSGSQQPDRISNISASRPKSVDFSRYVSSTWKGLSVMDGNKSSKSVTFTSQDMVNNMEDPAGMLIDPPVTAASTCGKDSDERQRLRSLSYRLQKNAHVRDTAEDGDLWLAFLIDTGIMQISDSNAANSDITVTRKDTRIDDPDYIISQLGYYSMTPSYNLTKGTKDDYEETHHKNPGLFYDTLSMDDPEEAYKKMSRILKDIVASQKTLKPLYDLDFANQLDGYPFLKKRIDAIIKQIAPHRVFV